jgi:hypothetical protein
MFRLGDMFKSRDFFVLFIIFLFAVGLAYVGFGECNPNTPCSAISQGGRFYASLILVSGLAGRSYSLQNGDPFKLVIAQFTVFSLAAGFVAVKAVVVSLHRDARIFLARSKRMHTVVCGLGALGTQIVQNLLDAHKGAVAVDLDSGSANALTCERQGVPVLKGDAKNIQVLRMAGVPRAKTIAICTGRDAENVEVALCVIELVKRRRIPVRHRPLLLVDIRTDWLSAKLASYTKGLGSKDVEFRFFNTNENAARQLIEEMPLPAVDGARTFILIGFGTMGREVALHIIRAAPVPVGQTIRIVILDRAATLREQQFRSMYPAASELVDLNFVSAELRADTPDSLRLLEGQLMQAEPIAAVVCLRDDDTSLYVGLGLRAMLDRLGHRDKPVYVRLERHRRLGEFAAGIENRGPALDRLHSFGSLATLLTSEIVVDDGLDTLAKALHDSHCEAALSKDSQGRAMREATNPSLVPWSELGETYKMANRHEADHLRIALRQVGLDSAPGVAAEALKLTADELNKLAELDHRRWVIERKLRGWKHGATRDEVLLTHPELLEWGALPESSREFNRERMRRLPEVCRNAGMRMIRNHPIQSVRERAYAIWEQEGRPIGRDLAHWLKAEVEIEVCKPSPPMPTG